MANARFNQVATANNWKHVMTGGMTRTLSLMCKGIVDWHTADMLLAPVKVDTVTVDGGRIYVTVTHEVFGGLSTHCLSED